MSEERRVAVRLMGIWTNNPFEIKVNILRPLSCIFNHNWQCSAAQVKGVRKECVGLACPGKGKIAPEECPLRHGSIEVKG